MNSLEAAFIGVDGVDGDLTGHSLLIGFDCELPAAAPAVYAHPMPGIDAFPPNGRLYHR